MWRYKLNDCWCSTIPEIVLHQQLKTLSPCNYGKKLKKLHITHVHYDDSEPVNIIAGGGRW